MSWSWRLSIVWQSNTCGIDVSFNLNLIYCTKFKRKQREPCWPMLRLHFSAANTHTEYQTQHACLFPLCLPLSPTLVFLSSHLLMWTHTYKKPTQCIVQLGLYLFCIVASHRCFFWQNTHTHTYKHTHTCEIGSLSLCYTSTHLVAFDRALSRDGVYADQHLSTLLDRVTYTVHVCESANSVGEWRAKNVMGDNGYERESMKGREMIREKAINNRRWQ